MQVGAAIFDLVLAAGADVLFVVGTGKNVGKTVTARAVYEAAYRRGVRVGMMSIGRDGEAVDAVERASQTETLSASRHVRRNRARRIAAFACLGDARDLVASNGSRAGCVRSGRGGRRLRTHRSADGFGRARSRRVLARSLRGDDRSTERSTGWPRSPAAWVRS